MAAAMSLMTACGAQGGNDVSGTQGQPVGSAGQGSGDVAGQGSGNGAGEDDQSGAGEADRDGQDGAGEADQDGVGQDGGSGTGQDSQGTGGGAGGRDGSDAQAAGGADGAESNLPDYLQGVDLTGGEAVQHTFTEVTVHDPSVIKVDGTWYVFVLPTLLNMIMCAIIGYGFARYEFPLKKVMLGILIFSFIIPPQITMMPNYLLYNDLGILNSIKAFLLPALLGQGIKSQLYILIFFQFFRQIPQALIEAAKIDGCGHFKTFVRIAVPSAAPAILVVFLFSLVWYWNESYLTQLYVCGVLGNSDWNTLMVALKGFNDSYSQVGGSVTGEAMGSLNEGIKMAAAMLSILPVLLLYFVLQKQFVESVDRTGITGE